MKSELPLDLGSFCLHVLGMCITDVEQPFNDSPENARAPALSSFCLECWLPVLGLWYVVQLAFVLTLTC